MDLGQARQGDIREDNAGDNAKGFAVPVPGLSRLSNKTEEIMRGSKERRVSFERASLTAVLATSKTSLNDLFKNTGMC